MSRKATLASVLLAVAGIVMMGAISWADGFLSPSSGSDEICGAYVNFELIQSNTWTGIDGKDYLIDYTNCEFTIVDDVGETVATLEWQVNIADGDSTFYNDTSDGGVYPYTPGEYAINAEINGLNDMALPDTLYYQVVNLTLETA